MFFQAFKHPASSAWKVLPSVLCLAPYSPIKAQHQLSQRLLITNSFSKFLSQQILPLMTTASCLSVGLHLRSESYTPGIPRTHYNAGTLNAFNTMSASFPSGKHCWGGKQRARSTLGYPTPWIQISSSVAHQLWNSRKATSSPFHSLAAISPKWKYY